MPQLPNRVRALESFTDTGLWFADGSVLDADVIVFCTGFERDARKEAARIVGQEIGDKLEDYWGLDQEGELRGVYKRISCKAFSSFLLLAFRKRECGSRNADALQIRASGTTVEA